MHDCGPYLGRLDRMRQRFGFEVAVAGLDAGYFTPHICKGLIERGIYGVIGYRRPNYKEGYFYKREYEAERDGYVCLNGEFLAYRTTDHIGYREYGSQVSRCAACPSKARCTQSKQKTVKRYVWQHYKETVDDAEELHGHRYARFRSLAKVNAQALLVAACQNMKKMARLLEEAAIILFFPLKSVTCVALTLMAATLH